MSWHLPHRLTTMHHAVSMALLYSVSAVALPTVAQAAIMGKTTVTSAQHEPLAASIVVTDIDAADFSANLASAVVYQQMGLTPTASMSVRFVPTSANSGQVLITTTQPVSMPFADVVLALNDSGERNVIPKTLLMPLGNNAPTKQPNRIVAAAQKPNLPIVSIPNAQPLKVKREAPPPLFASSGVQAPMQTPNVSSVTTANIRPATAPPLQASSITETLAMTVQADKTSSVTNSNVNTANTNAADINASPNTINNNANTTPNNTKPAQIPAATDKQLDILNIQVTRQIQKSAAADVTNIDEANVATKMTAAPKQIESASQVTAPEPSMVDNNPAAITVQTADNPDSTATRYTVQRNDNLWIISQQIAQKNNLDIQTVMTQIQNQNPDAFVAKDASRLKANAQLNLPDYDVVPSQQGLQAAIVAQRQHHLKSPTTATNTSTKQEALQAQSDKTKTANKAKAVKPKSIQASKRPDKPVATVTQTLSQAQFSVLAPGRDGSADGTQTKAAAATGNGLSTDILATLKASRQRNASQAKRLVATHSTLGSYTKKLQLQNQKLAELEARLKKLRNQ